MKKLQIIILLSFLSMATKAQVLADFTYTTSFCGPYNVNFLDTSLGGGFPIASWEWDFADGTTSTAQSPTHIYSFAGTYNVCLTATNSNGESDTECKMIVLTTPTADAGPDMELNCATPSVILDGSASSQGASLFYDWTTINGSILSGVNTLNPEVSSAGDYTLIVTDAQTGCTAVSNVVVTVDINIPVASIVAPSVLTCVQTSVTLDASGSSQGTNYSYQWSNASTAMTIEVNTPGTYSLTVTDNFNGCTAVSSIVVEEDIEIPTCNINANPITLGCTTAVLNATGTSTGSNIEYLWTTLDGTILSGETTLSPEVEYDGTYDLTVTNTASGCTSVCSITAAINIFCFDDGDCANGEEVWNSSTCNCDQINVPDPTPCINDGDCSNGIETWNPSTCGCDILNPIVPTFSIPNTSFCEGEMVSLTAGMICSDCTIELFDPTGILLCNSLPCSFTPINGTYIFTVTDNATGCSNTDNFTMTVSDEITISSDITNVSCYADADGAIDLTVIGGSTPYDFLWANGANTEDLTGLQAAVYTVTVVDANGCQVEHIATVLEPSEMSAIITSVSPVSCFGDSDGEIDITVTGGVTPYSYFWLDGSIEEDRNDLGAGIYTVTVGDANFCTQLVLNFTVEEPTELLLNTTSTPASCNGGMDGSIELSVTGGTQPYTYLWSPGFWTDQNINNLTAGTYTVTVTDSNACTATSETIVEETSDLGLFITNDTTICAGETVQLEVNWIPNIAYPIQWSPAFDLSDPNIYNPIASPTETTTYTVTVTDPGGCTDTKEVTVTVNNYIDFGLQLFSNSPVCEGEPLEFYANLGGATYVWSDPNGAVLFTDENPIIPMADASMSGQYDLNIVDNAGCVLNVTFDVFVDADCVWPGDTDTNKVVNNFDLLNIGLAFDSVGPPRFNGSLSWMGQGVEDWSQNTPTTNVNFKHADTDGNGMVNSNDTLAITQNWGLMHNFTNTPVLNQFTDLPIADGAVLTAPFYVEPDTLPEGETIGLDIILGDVSNVVTGLYGIAFSIEYDTSVVVPGSASIDFSNCWLGDVDADAITIQRDFPAEGRIDAAITRIDGMEMDGAGLFGEFIITLDDDILLWDPKNDEIENDVFANFAITNYHLINFSQEEILVEATTTSAPVDGTTSIHNTYLDKEIQLYPNPANELFYISSSKNLFIEQVKIYSTTSLIKAMKTNTTDVIEIPTMDLPNGIYFIELQTEKGVVTKKVSVIK